MRKLLLASTVLVPLLTPALSLAAGLVRAPDEACAYLAEDGLGGTGDYREYRPGKYYCWSLRKEIAAGDPQRQSVRYTAEGTEEAVSSLTLELQVPSRSEVQRGHMLFLEYARALVTKALATEMPEEIGKAVLAARPGRWPLAGAEVVIEKRQVKGEGYELALRIE